MFVWLCVGVFVCVWVCGLFDWLCGCVSCWCVLCCVVFIGVFVCVADCLVDCVCACMIVSLLCVVCVCG